MGKIDNHVATMLYLHPSIRGWVEQRARFDTDSISGVIRRALRQHIKRVDPAAWLEIEAALRADAEPDAEPDENKDKQATGG